MTLTHYENPKPNGCAKDERVFSGNNVTGISLTGDWCAPNCGGLFGSACPNDKPSGVKTNPLCIPRIFEGKLDHYCALACNPDA